MRIETGERKDQGLRQTPTIKTPWLRLAPGGMSTLSGLQIRFDV